MNPLRSIWFRLWALFRKEQLDEEMQQEMRSHLERQTEANIESGMPPDEARQAALRQFGWLESVTENCREQRTIPWLEDLAKDAGFGLRQLARNPGFTAVTVATLALGIGACTAVYSVVNSVLLHPLPGPAPERLVQIAERNYTTGGFHEENHKPFFVGVSPPVLERLLESPRPLSDVSWADSLYLDRRTEDFTEEEGGWRVSPNFFELWNVPPMLGRTFAKDEALRFNEMDQPVQDGVIVISFSWWKSLFGADPGIIGKTTELGGHQFTIIGVMPPHFQFPWGGSKFWLPARPLRLPRGWSRAPNTRVYARLGPGVTVRQAETRLAPVAQRVAQDYKSDKVYSKQWSLIPGGLGLWVRAVRSQFTDGQGDLERTLFGLLAAIGFVLLIVCANVANLTMARTEKRQQELAIRAAVGAGRSRLARQLLTENLLLACLGTLAGLAVAAVMIKLLATLIPLGMPRLKPIRIDTAALGFALLTAIATGLGFGCAPAWQAGRGQLGQALKQAGAQVTAGLRRRRYRDALVILEFALTLVLLSGAGLMLESVVRLLHVNPGFDPQNLLRVDLHLPWNTYNDYEHREHALQLRSALYQDLQQRLAALPGVEAVGLGKHGAWPEKVTLPGRSEPVEVLLDGCGVVEGDLFRAMRIPLQAGRELDRNAVGQNSVLVNETLARMLWPGENAVGKKFDRESWRAPNHCEVVGVVGDIRDAGYGRSPRPTFYRPCGELGLEGMSPFLVIRTRNDPRLLVKAVRRELHAAEPAMQDPGIVLSRQELYDSTQAQRTYLLFLGVFASAALLLAALGIYGVLAYSVARRTRELGLRMAMGARRPQVMGLVLKEGVRLVGAGALAGVLAAFWLTRLLRSQLFQVNPTDPVVFSLVILLLMAIAMLACLLPAIRATRVDPMTALRCE